MLRGSSFFSIQPVIYYINRSVVILESLIMCHFGCENQSHAAWSGAFAHAARWQEALGHASDKNMITLNAVAEVPSAAVLVR